MSCYAVRGGLLFEVRGQASCDVLPWSEGAGEVNGQFVGRGAFLAEHEVVGVEVA